MSDPKQLPYLIKLLDDESETVKETVMKELVSFGAELQTELTRQNIVLDRPQKLALHGFLESQNMLWIRQRWPHWFALEDHVKLESALTLLAEFQYDRIYPVPLKFLLDQLAEEYSATYSTRDALQLSEFLFKIKNIKGAEADYRNPMNSNLNYVIEKKRGIPISLACIYILVGQRLGLQIQGLNFPGHFLTRAFSDNRSFIVDCFHHGRHADEKHLATMNISQLLTTETIAGLECRPETIIGRVLRNLVHTYQLEKDDLHSALMTYLLEQMPKDP